MTLQSTAITDIGRRRAENEDAYVELPDQGVYCVADGMGGGEFGAEASATIIDFVVNAFAGISREMPLDERTGIFDRTINNASSWIKERFDELGAQGGATIVALLIDLADGRRATVLHAGDSRAYIYRRTSLRLITRDHTPLERDGITDVFTKAMLRGVITRAVGLKKDVELDRNDISVEPGDILLLCSDGLTGMLPDEVIEGVLARNHADGLETTARVLVDTANAAGGDDNITVLLLSVPGGKASGKTDSEGSRKRKVQPAELSRSGDARTQSARTSPLLLIVLLLALALLIGLTAMAI